MAGLGKGSSAVRMAAKAFSVLAIALKRLVPFLAVAGAAFAVYESATTEGGFVNDKIKDVKSFFGSGDKQSEDKQIVANTKSESVTSNTTNVEVSLKSDMLDAKITENNTNENEKAMDALRSGSRA